MHRNLLALSTSHRLDLSVPGMRNHTAPRSHTLGLWAYEA